MRIALLLRAWPPRAPDRALDLAPRIAVTGGRGIWRGGERLGRSAPCSTSLLPAPLSGL